jgi:hypothetical protein
VQGLILRRIGAKFGGSGFPVGIDALPSRTIALRPEAAEPDAGVLPRAATDKYADDVTVNYYVLLANRNPSAPQGTLLTGQASLLTVPARQNDLHTVMYVNPRSLERFFDGKIPTSTSSAVVDVGVTISKGGQVVAEKSLNSKSGAWWPQIQGTPGFLLGKPETPFAPLNADYYEPVKKTP